MEKEEEEEEEVLSLFKKEGEKFKKLVKMIRQELMKDEEKTQKEIKIFEKPLPYVTQQSKTQVVSFQW